MVGFITTRHLVTHAPLIVHEFGLRAYLRCVRRVLSSHGATTFLDCLTYARATA